MGLLAGSLAFAFVGKIADLYHSGIFARRNVLALQRPAMAMNFMKVKGGSVFLQRRGIMPARGVGYPHTVLAPPPPFFFAPLSPFLPLLPFSSWFRYALDSVSSQRDVCGCSCGGRAVSWSVFSPYGVFPAL